MTTDRQQREHYILSRMSHPSEEKLNPQFALAEQRIPLLEKELIGANIELVQANARVTEVEIRYKEALLRIDDLQNLINEAMAVITEHYPSLISSFSVFENLKCHSTPTHKPSVT